MTVNDELEVTCKKGRCPVLKFFCLRDRGTPRKPSGIFEVLVTLPRRFRFFVPNPCFVPSKMCGDSHSRAFDFHDDTKGSMKCCSFWTEQSHNGGF